MNPMYRIGRSIKISVHKHTDSHGANTSISASPTFSVIAETESTVKRRLVTERGAKVTSRGEPSLGNAATVMLEPSLKLSVPERM